MITLLQSGKYQLVETMRHTKMLLLDGKESFAWIHAGEIGEILVASHKPHKADHVLAKGSYRLYTVKDEKDLTDLAHLELFVGDGVWQGYLLPTGMPNGGKVRNRIVPTKEIITKSLN